MTAITKQIEITEQLAGNLFENCGFIYEGINYEFVKKANNDNRKT